MVTRRYILIALVILCLWLLASTGSYRYLYASLFSPTYHSYRHLKFSASIFLTIFDHPLPLEVQPTLPLSANKCRCLIGQNWGVMRALVFGQLLISKGWQRQRRLWQWWGEGWQSGMAMWMTQGEKKSSSLVANYCHPKSVTTSVCHCEAVVSVRKCFHRYIMQCHCLSQCLCSIV